MTESRDKPASDLDSAFDSDPFATPADPIALPKPPPPPPAPPGSQVSPDLAEALARLEQITTRLLGLEREVLDLQAFRRRFQGASSSAASMGDSGPALTRLRAELDEMRRERDGLKSALAQASTGDVATLKMELAEHKAKSESGHTARRDVETQLDSAKKALDAARDQNASDKKALEALKRDLELSRSKERKLTEDIERIDGEHQALKILQEENKQRLEAASQHAEGLELPPEIADVVAQTLAERDGLKADKTRLESELARIKSEVSKRVNHLRSEIDRLSKEHDTVKLQKDNLMRELRSRDAHGTPTQAREVTLEDITNSEVFKNMLGNVRRTSRQEVTHLHDAVASIRAIDPHAYEVVLEVVSKQFEVAQMENPLAMLPPP